LAGFGNLTGEMEMWDLKEMKQIGFCKSSSASYCQWSLDDRKVLTGIVTPRLRVDNCFKVFSYTGTYLKKVGYEET
jgi:translation initiation factor 2A